MEKGECRPSKNRRYSPRIYFLEKTTPREAINYYAELFNTKVDADEILKDVLLEESAKTYFEDLSGGQKEKQA